MSALKTVKHDFTRVAELTITPKADGAGETAYRGWDHNQRFVLSVDDSEKAA